MFDEHAKHLLERLPNLPGLSSSECRRTLSAAYAYLVERRLRVADGVEEEGLLINTRRELRRLADALESVAVFDPLNGIEVKPEIRDASAFAAAEAMAILAQLPLAEMPDADEESVDAIRDADNYNRVEAGLLYTLDQLALSIEARPRSAIQDDFDTCISVFHHRAVGGAIYTLPDQLVEEFHHTDCDEVRMSDLKFPFQNIYLQFKPPERLELDSGAVVDGCYAVRQGDECLLVLTTKLVGVDYAHSLSVTCKDPTFSIHLPVSRSADPQHTGDDFICVPEAVRLGIEEFLAKNAPPTDNFTQTIKHPDGTEAFIEDVRAKSRLRRIEVFRSQEPVFRACLNIIVNALCFISFRPEEVTAEPRCISPASSRPQSGAWN